MKQMDNARDGSLQNPFEEMIVIPRKTLHVAWARVLRLRLMVLVLVVTCAVLAAASWDAITRSLLLRAEDITKSTTIERLQNENKILQEKLSFKRKVDSLIAKIQKEAPWVDIGIIRPAAEEALHHTTDPALYLAIGLVETEFQAKIVHADGVALGMHGLCPKDWHSFLKAKGIMNNRGDYFDPVKSFRGSEAVLSALIQECGSLEKALLYYNGGEPAAAGMIPRSTAYAKRVMHLRRVFAA